MPVDVIFLELEPFSRAMRDRDLPDDWLRDLQQDILLRRGRIDRPPKLRGIEKVRADNPAAAKGKRGGLRVYFVRYVDLGVVVLVHLSGKDVEADISHKEKQALSALMTRLRKEIESNAAKDRERAGRRPPRRR